MCMVIQLISSSSIRPTHCLFVLIYLFLCFFFCQCVRLSVCLSTACLFSVSVHRLPVLYVCPPPACSLCLSTACLFSVSVHRLPVLCVCPPPACSLCLSAVCLFSVSSASVCISLSIWLSVSPRAGCLYEFFSTSVSSFAGNYVALSNASQREVCEGFGTNNKYQTPASLFVTCLQSPRRANIEGLLALFSLSVSLSVYLPVCIVWCSQFNF